MLGWEDLFATSWARHRSRLTKRVTTLTARQALIANRAPSLELSKFQEINISASWQTDISSDAEDMRRRQMIYTSLKFVDIENEQDNAQFDLVKVRTQYPRDQYAEVGGWLMEHPAFQNWFHAEPSTQPLLWLHGKLGSGKSPVSSDLSSLTEL